MTDNSGLKLIGSMYCKQYATEATFFIDLKHTSGQRHLVVQYADDKRPEFAAAIPNDWTEQRVLDLIFWPMNADAPYPAWEVPARAYGSDELMEWQGR